MRKYPMSVNDKSIIDENEVAKLGFDPIRLQRVEERIKEDIAKGKCHGASIIAARHGKIALDITEGFSNLSEQKKKLHLKIGFIQKIDIFYIFCKKLSCLLVLRNYAKTP